MIKIVNFYVAIFMSIWCSLSMAMSGIGNAVILESRGLPCFTIEENSGTKDGLHLSSLVVSELTSRPGEQSPDELWGFSNKSGSPMTISPQDCIRYGELPAGAELRAEKKLAPYHVYGVSIGARPKDRNIIGYMGEFCVKPAADGSASVQVISRKKGESERFYDLCKNPTLRNNTRPSGHISNESPLK